MDWGQKWGQILEIYKKKEKNSTPDYHIRSEMWQWKYLLMFHPLIFIFLEKDSYCSETTSPNKPASFTTTTWTMTVEYQLSWTFLHSHLISTPLNISGAAEDWESKENVNLIPNQIHFRPFRRLSGANVTRCKYCRHLSLTCYWDSSDRCLQQVRRWLLSTQLYLKKKKPDIYLTGTCCSTWVI